MLLCIILLRSRHWIFFTYYRGRYSSKVQTKSATLALHESCEIIYHPQYIFVVKLLQVQGENLIKGGGFWKRHPWSCDLSLKFWNTLQSLTTWLIIFTSSGLIHPEFLYAATSCSFRLWRLTSCTFLTALTEHKSSFHPPKIRCQSHLSWTIHSNSSSLSRG